MEADNEAATWVCAFCGAIPGDREAEEFFQRRSCACGAEAIRVATEDPDDAVDFALKYYDVRFRPEARGVDLYLYVELAWAGVEARIGSMVSKRDRRTGKFIPFSGTYVFWFKRICEAVPGPRLPLPAFSFPYPPSPVSAEHLPPGFPFEPLHPIRSIVLDIDFPDDWPPQTWHPETPRRKPKPRGDSPAVPQTYVSLFVAPGSGAGAQQQADREEQIDASSLRSQRIFFGAWLLIIIYIIFMILF
ncbi:MAG TPA: hypothetical protein PKY30_06275 [Myxococcota bacterium]|nr:hypothetical protein [Myxococcota bacterium]